MSELRTLLSTSWLAAVLVAALAAAPAARAQVAADAPAEITLEEALAVSVRLPAGVAITDLVVGAQDGIQVGSLSELHGQVATLGGLLSIGAQARVGTTTSGGDVVLEAKSLVGGDVLAGGKIVTRAKALIEGTSQAGVTLGDPSVLDWMVQAPDATQGAIALLPNETRDLEPGVFGALDVAPSGRLILHSGVYVFSSARVQPDAALIVEDADGPVQIYVRGGLFFAGEVRSAYTHLPQLIVVVHGAAPVEVQSPFTGALIAPHAELRAASGQPLGHRALFLAHSVRLHPQTLVRPYSLEWSEIAEVDPYPSPEGEAPLHEMTRSPVDIALGVAGDGTGRTSGASESDEPISFRLPESYPVVGGIIGNGSVGFEFLTPGGTLVTCLYNGGSTTSAPADSVELNLGRLLIFAGCSDGLPVDAPREGTRFGLSVSPVPGYPVKVRSPMIGDGFCSGEMELLSADETRRMRAGFDWSAATPVASHNPDGTFALYYAWVYIRDVEEAAALRKLYIHILQTPLFTEEWNRYAGRCGVFTNPGDGEGVFVPVVIPGLTYNRLIEALSNDEIKGDRVVFDAVILRALPAAARNPNGSIRLDVLGQGRFRYLHYEPHPLPGPERLDLTGEAAKAFVDVLTFVGEGLRDVAEVITNTLGALDRLFRDEVTMTIHLHGITGDPSFVSSRGATCVAAGDPFACCTGLGTDDGTAPCSEDDDPIMLRAWGPNRGSPLAAPGLEVTIVQQLFDLPIPATSQGRTSLTGRAVIDAVENGERFGSGLCVELKSRGAFMTDFLIATKLCDLRGFDAANPTLGGDRFELADFSTSREVDVHAENERLVGLYQADDVFRYGRSVMSYAPRRARVVSGFWAATFSVQGANDVEQPYTPCLGYRNVVSDTLIAAGLAVGGLLSTLPIVGQGAGIAAVTFSAIIGDADIVMATTTSIPRSRELMSHEYGHYMLCSMMQDVNPLAIDNLLIGFLAGPSNLRRPTRYMNEALADYFTGQVAGGHNYNWMGDVTTDEGFCDGRTPCWDRNDLRTHATNDDDPSDIGRFATLVHDAFDGHTPSLGRAVPGDGDLWIRRDTVCTDVGAPFPCCTGPGTSDGSDFCGQLLLTPAGSGYGSTDAGLERMSLDGSSFDLFAKLTAISIPPGVVVPDAYTDEVTFGALSAAMAFAGQNWCERCRVMGLHSTTNPADTVGALFSTCVADPLIADVLGAPPEPDLRLDAGSCTPCPDSFISNGDGICEQCEFAVIGNECVEIPNPD